MPGTNYAWAKAGRLFKQTCTPLGGAIAVYTATAAGDTGITAMPIWNPPGSAVDVELVSVDIAFASGTAAYGPIGLMIRALNGIATGALCSALTVTTPDNGYALGGVGTKVQSNNSIAGTNLTVTAGAITDWKQTLFSSNLEAQTGTAHSASVSKYSFDGEFIISPGVICYLASKAATSALFCITMTWLEIDR